MKGSLSQQRLVRTSGPPPPSALPLIEYGRECKRNMTDSTGGEYVCILRLEALRHLKIMVLDGGSSMPRKTPIIAGLLLRSGCNCHTSHSLIPVPSPSG